MWMLSACLRPWASAAAIRSIRSIKTWQRAVKQLKQIDHDNKVNTPQTSSSNTQSYAAWRGDKIIGAAAANAFDRQVNNLATAGNATRVVALAVSNYFFAKHASTLLPHLVTASKEDNNDNKSDRQLGTLLEATVFRVSQEVEGQEEAIDDLATWLVEQALIAQSYEDMKGQLIDMGGTVQTVRTTGRFEVEASLNGIRRTARSTESEEEAEQLAATRVLALYNAKGNLIAMGGTVQTIRTGGSDHTPIFEAVALCNGKSATATGTSKKRAEQLAAGHLLSQQKQRQQQHDKNGK
mmetsp:Transcript_24748/g.68430  ORF Transcript_24748/g.68430 Transcript_24748/m.68430 type:complete len:295 (-) Transcript_24748:546-1430(-)